MIEFIKNNHTNREAIASEFKRVSNTLGIDEMINILLFINDEDTINTIDYDVITYVYAQLRSRDDNDYDEQIFEKGCELAELDNYNIPHEGDDIICSYSNDIISYLKEIGYNIDDIKDGKYLLHIHFEKDFKVSFYDRTKKIHPKYLKTLDDVKNALKSGVNVKDFKYLCSGYQYIDTEDVDSDTLKNALLTHDRKKLLNIHLPYKEGGEPLINLHDSTIPLDIRLYYYHGTIGYCELIDEMGKGSIIDEDYLFDVEIENTKENIDYLESLGYTSIYSEFDRLFINMEKFIYRNTHFLEDFEDSEIIFNDMAEKKLPDYKFKSIVF